MMASKGYRSSRAGIYIHVPFCLRKCNYCAFLSSPAGEMGREKYVDTLLKEIDLRINTITDVDTVFFGGGTPSLLTPKQISSVVEAIRNACNLTDDAEITMEANPATLTLENLRGYREAGINRLSMGVQSFHDERLRVLGRMHSAEDAKREFRLAREAGFDNINIDLMFSIPGSALEEVLEDIDCVCELGPEHVSFYSLQLEEGTPFFEAFERGELEEIPDELDREMYHQGIARLAEHGYRQYEISNFCRDGKLSRHNYKYWCMNEYLGFGLGASSYACGCRIVNVSDMGEYVRMIEEGRVPAEDIYRNSGDDDVAEAAFTGLRRLEGIWFDEILGSREKFEAHYAEVMPEIMEFAANGFLVIDDEGMRLTERGIDVSNRIMALLV